MMFSTRAEYGVRVMIHLARQAETGGPGSGPCSLAQIAESDGLPFAYLEHLAARLKRAGLIESRRGAHGGYLLARPAAEITMAEVIEALEGQIAPIECVVEQADGKLTCTRESESDFVCTTKVLWTKVQGAIVRTLTEVTLAELAKPGERKRRVTETAQPQAAAVA